MKLSEEIRLQKVGDHVYHITEAQRNMIKTLEQRLTDQFILEEERGRLIVLNTDNEKQRIKFAERSTELEREIERLKEYKKYSEEYKDWVLLKQEIERLKEYVQHNIDCKWWSYAGKPCTCGLDELTKEK